MTPPPFESSAHSKMAIQHDIAWADRLHPNEQSRVKLTIIERKERSTVVNNAGILVDAPYPVSTSAATEMADFTPPPCNAAIEESEQVQTVRNGNHESQTCANQSCQRLREILRANTRAS